MPDWVFGAAHRLASLTGLRPSVTQATCQSEHQSSATDLADYQFSLRELVYSTRRFRAHDFCCHLNPVAPGLPMSLSLIKSFHRTKQNAAEAGLAVRKNRSRACGEREALLYVALFESP